MTDQYKQNDGDQSEKSKVEWTKPASLLNILSSKFAPIAKIQHMQLPAWSLLVFLGIILLVFAWKHIAVSQAESRLEKERTEMTQNLETERSIIIRKAREYADSQYNKEEERFGLVLSWAVRGELLRNNLDQARQYLDELVKMRDTERVVLISDDGKLLVSTDKRLEEAEAKELYPDNVLQLQKIAIMSDVDGRKLLVVPVMGLNSRMAIVVVSYKHARLSGS
jgi:hypothetical protein